MKPMNILMVEDDEDIAGLVAYNLERQGWKVQLVHNGLELAVVLCCRTNIRCKLLCEGNRWI